MTWSSLDGNLAAYRLANNVGLTIDGLLTDASEIKNKLSNAIKDLKDNLDNGIELLQRRYQDVEVSGSLPDIEFPAGAPDLSGVFPTIDDMPEMPTVADFPEKPSVAFPTVGSITAPTIPQEPDIPDPPVLQPVDVEFPEYPEIESPPTVPDAPQMDDFSLSPPPAGPGIGQLIDANAYESAFEIEKAAAAFVANQERWQAQNEAFASGIGFATPFYLARLEEINEAERRKLAEIAGNQRVEMLKNLREDKRWAYEHTFGRWAKENELRLDAWKTETNLSLNVWIKQAQTALDLWAKRSDTIIELYRTGSEAEKMRATALLDIQNAKLEAWKTRVSSAIDVWSKLTGAKVDIYSKMVDAQSQKADTELKIAQAKVDVWKSEIDAVNLDNQTRIKLFEAGVSLIRDRMEIGFGAVQKRLEAENGRLNALLEAKKAQLEAAVSGLNWEAKKAELQMRNEELSANDARTVQEAAIKIGQEAVASTANAYAEFYKAAMAGIALHATTGADVNSYLNENWIYRKNIGDDDGGGE